jgi:hypothetical protein
MKFLKIIGSIAVLSVGMGLLQHAFSTEGFQLFSSMAGGSLVGGGVSMFIFTLQG